MLERSWLQPAMLQGLIVLSGGQDGDIGQAFARGKDEEAARCLARWQGLCGDRFYLEMQRTGRAGEQAYAEAVVDLAREHGVPAVATNDVRFLTRAEFEAHEARVCIHDGALLADAEQGAALLARSSTSRVPAEMAELFADVPELLVNSVEIAKRCSLEIKLGASMLPAYPVPSGASTESFLREEAAARAWPSGWSRRKTLRGVERDAPTYAARLDLELGVICAMGFAGYFLIVADFIRWARENGVPVGPGRGSGAGSLVAFALGITDLDPIEHDLLFERFLNPERVSMPDFDVDFCMEGRDRVIEYVANKYGRDRVSQIITYGTLAAKAVVRDVGRVLGHNYGVRRQDRQAHSFRNRHDARQGARAGRGTAAPVRGRFRGARADRSCANARRPVAKRRYARGRGRHCALGAHRFHAAVLRRGQHHAGHPIRQGRRRGGRPGQVRLSRPAHAHRHRLGGARHQCRARPRRTNRRS